MVFSCDFLNVKNFRQNLYLYYILFLSISTLRKIVYKVDDLFDRNSCRFYPVNSSGIPVVLHLKSSRIHVVFHLVKSSGIPVVFLCSEIVRNSCRFSYVHIVRNSCRFSSTVVIYSSQEFLSFFL